MTISAGRSPLEEQIAQWRMYLRRRRAIHGPDVEELEGHLRDQMAGLTEAGLAGDEAFLVAVKRMGSFDALSREFAREHSERLWKQLVMAPEAAGEPGKATRTETLIVLSLAVAAGLAVKLPALFGLPLSPDEEVALCPLPTSTRLVSRPGAMADHLPARVLRVGGVCGRRLSAHVRLPLM